MTDTASANGESAKHKAHSQYPSAWQQSGGRSGRPENVDICQTIIDSDAENPENPDGVHGPETFSQRSENV
ncbi:hypothetical protein DSECCO2_401730 [anaerobic digester metagenome]